MTDSIEIAARVVIVSPDPKRRGCKLITVNGESWGYVNIHGHGGGGNTFTFSDYFHNDICKESAGKQRPIIVRGDKMERRSQPTGAVISPVAERILETVRGFIRNGKLKSPAVLKAEDETAREAYRLKLAAREVAEAAEFEAKADQIVKTLPREIRLTDEANTVRALIVAAMRWAQTK